MKKIFLITLLVTFTIGGFISCSNSNSEKTGKEQSSSTDLQENDASPTIVGYWERTAGGDYDPDIAMILGFKGNGQIEKIALYHEGTDDAHGYRENSSGNYYFDGASITVWGESYPVILNGNSLEFHGMKFQKISEDDVKRRVASLKDFEEYLQ